MEVDADELHPFVTREITCIVVNFVQVMLTSIVLLVVPSIPVTYLLTSLVYCIRHY